MISDTAIESPVVTLAQTQGEDDIAIPSPPKLKRQRAEERPKSVKKAAVAVETIVSRDDALARTISIARSRKFNGVDYDSFPEPLHVLVSGCAMLTSLSKYGKYLARVSDDDAAPLLATESVLSALAPTGYTFAGLGSGLDGGVYSLKWNNVKSLFVREDETQKVPYKGDSGVALVEISGMYRNPETLVCGLVSRILSFQRVDPATQ